MTDDQQHDESHYRQQMAQLLVDVGPAVFSQWRKTLSEGGSRTVPVVCEACGKSTRARVHVADVEEQRRLMTFLIEQSTKGDVIPLEAANLLKDTSELSNAELAEQIVRLEALIAAESTPERQELSALLETADADQISAILRFAKTKC